MTKGKHIKSLVYDKTKLHAKRPPSPATGKQHSAAGRYLVKYLRIYSPSLAAIALVQLLILTFGYWSNAFSIVALIFLSAVVYTALWHGTRHALVSSAIVLAYNTISLAIFVESLSFGDRNVRRIVLLALVLPSLALVIGRLKERIDYLLAREKNARKMAEDSEERLRFMAESMPQKIFTNTPTGKSDYFNPQWIEYTGWSSHQIRKGNWAKLIHPDDVEENIAKWEHSLKTGEPFAYEHRLKRHDGTYRWHITRAHAMRNDDGTVMMWVGSSTDIDDIKNALQREYKLEKTAVKLKEQREQLIALNKAKDEFISLASHQLRTPATGVKQYLGMLLEGYAGETTVEQMAYLKMAYESNEREITIINDLLKVAKVDAGKVILRKERTDLIALTRSVIDEQKSKFSERKQKVLFEPKQSSLFAVVDKNNIRMVLENIIDNAGKYTPANKTIQVSAGRSKGGVWIAVKDEGVGIDSKSIDKIFHKFSRIDNPLSIQVGGTGLGLYWAKKVIDLHGGTISVESEINNGSVFTIKLPR